MATFAVRAVCVRMSSTDALQQLNIPKSLSPASTAIFPASLPVRNECSQRGNSGNLDFSCHYRLRSVRVPAYQTRPATVQAAFRTSRSRTAGLRRTATSGTRTHTGSPPGPSAAPVTPRRRCGLLTMKNPYIMDDPSGRAGPGGGLGQSPWPAPVCFRRPSRLWRRTCIPGGRPRRRPESAGSSPPSFASPVRAAPNGRN